MKRCRRNLIAPYRLCYWRHACVQSHSPCRPQPSLSGPWRPWACPACARMWTIWMVVLRLSLSIPRRPVASGVSLGGIKPAAGR